MKRKLLYLLTGLLFYAGGVSAQESLILNYCSNGRWGSGITYGATASADALTGTWSNNDSNHTTTTTGYGRFEGGNWSTASSGGNGYLGGANWAATFTSGETHRITLSLIATDSERGNFMFRTKKGGTVVQSSDAFSGNATGNITFDITEDYDALEIIHMSYRNQIIPIASLTRTIISDAVAKPTITAPSTYDGETSVTITPGANTHHVKYSISGSNDDVTNVSITAETIINIEGTSDVTISATAYNEDESESNAATPVTITYDNTIPSGIINVWSGNQSITNGWSSGETVSISNSKFANLEVGDYIYLTVTHTNAVPNIGFRNNWDDSVLKTYTETSGGNAAYGNMTAEESSWWLKITDETLLNIFKTGTPRVQGVSGDAGVTIYLTSVDIHKATSISETADNTITKYTDMIVNLDRSFVANTWNTVCLPFVPTAAQAEELFGAGYQLAAFTGVDGETMQFTKTIGQFEAGTPYLVKPTANLSTPVTLADVDITARTARTVTYGSYSFKGSFTTTTFSSDLDTYRFVASGNKLKKPTNGSTLKALRAYFVVPAAAPARGFTIDGIEDEPTGINTVQGEGLNAQGYYNLAGQRVAQPSRGLYIVNGKKVVIK